MKQLRAAFVFVSCIAHGSYEGYAREITFAREGGEWLGYPSSAVAMIAASTTCLSLRFELLELDFRPATDDRRTVDDERDRGLQNFSIVVQVGQRIKRSERSEAEHAAGVDKEILWRETNVLRNLKLIHQREGKVQALQVLTESHDRDVGEAEGIHFNVFQDAEERCSTNEAETHAGISVRCNANICELAQFQEYFFRVKVGFFLGADDIFVHSHTFYRQEDVKRGHGGKEHADFWNKVEKLRSDHLEHIWFYSQRSEGMRTKPTFEEVAPLLPRYEGVTDNAVIFSTTIHLSDDIYLVAERSFLIQQACAELSLKMNQSEPVNLTGLLEDRANSTEHRSELFGGEFVCPSHPLLKEKYPNQIFWEDLLLLKIRYKLIDATTETSKKAMTTTVNSMELSNEMDHIDSHNSTTNGYLRVQEESIGFAVIYKFDEGMDKTSTNKERADKGAWRVVLTVTVSVLEPETVYSFSILLSLRNNGAISDTIYGNFANYSTIWSPDSFPMRTEKPFWKHLYLPRPTRPVAVTLEIFPDTERTEKAAAYVTIEEVEGATDYYLEVTEVSVESYTEWDVSDLEEKKLQWRNATISLVDPVIADFERVQQRLLGYDSSMVSFLKQAPKSRQLMLTMNSWMLQPETSNVTDCVSHFRLGGYVSPHNSTHQVGGREANDKQFSDQFESEKIRLSITLTEAEIFRALDAIPSIRGKLQHVRRKDSTFAHTGASVLQFEISFANNLKRLQDIDQLDRHFLPYLHIVDERIKVGDSILQSTNLLQIRTLNEGDPETYLLYASDEQKKATFKFAVHDLQPVTYYSFRVTARNRLTFKSSIRSSKPSEPIRTGVIHRPVKYDLRKDEDLMTSNIDDCLMLETPADQEALLTMQTGLWTLEQWSAVPENTLFRPAVLSNALIFDDVEYQGQFDFLTIGDEFVEETILFEAARRIQDRPIYPPKREGASLVQMRPSRSNDPYAEDSGSLILFGGYDREDNLLLNDLWIFDIATKIWKELSFGFDVVYQQHQSEADEVDHDPSPQQEIPARSLHKAVVVDDTMFIYGGINATELVKHENVTGNLTRNYFLQDLWRIRFPVQQWTTAELSVEETISEANLTYYTVPVFLKSTDGMSCIEEMELEILFTHSCLDEVEIYLNPPTGHARIKVFSRQENDFDFQCLAHEYQSRQYHWKLSDRATTSVVSCCKDQPSIGDEQKASEDFQEQYSSMTFFDNFIGSELEGNWSVGFLDRRTNKYRGTLHNVQLNFRYSPCKPRAYATEISRDPAVQSGLDSLGAIDQALNTVETDEIFFISSREAKIGIFNSTSETLRVSPILSAAAESEDNVESLLLNHLVQGDVVIFTNNSILFLEQQFAAQQDKTAIHEAPLLSSRSNDVEQGVRVASFDPVTLHFEETSFNGSAQLREVESASHPDGHLMSSHDQTFALREDSAITSFTFVNFEEEPVFSEIIPLPGKQGTCQRQKKIIQNVQCIALFGGFDGVKDLGDLWFAKLGNFAVSSATLELQNYTREHRFQFCSDWKQMNPSLAVNSTIRLRSVLRKLFCEKLLATD